MGEELLERLGERSVGAERRGGCDSPPTSPPPLRPVTIR